ncbi:hypothetical protein B484DRAFT_396860 [Ochromonadaceae sp. CCMP2298]|nr:hypothetical protein B484DRAFT_396860 [Ochromonadaceae sp. CCMP2298]
MKLSLRTVLLALLCCLVLARKSKWDLSEIELEKQMEEGDEPEELENLFDHIEKVQNMRVDPTNPKFSKKGPKGTTAFVFLKKTDPKGAAYSAAYWTRLAQRYDGLLKSNSVTAEVHQADPGVFFFVCHKGWDLPEMLTFVARQVEVETFSVESRTWTPGEYLAAHGEEEDDDL